jgi:TPR repeat protein
MYFLGLALQAGRGVTKSEAEAARWHRAAAEAGYLPAMIQWSAMLEAGRGVGRDQRAAAQWMFKSLRAGDATAHEHMRTNAGKWSPEFRRELQRLMKEEGAYSGPIDGRTGAGFRAALDKLKPRQP